MKIFKKLMLPFCCLALLCTTGCKKTEEYFAYTNIPSDKYVVSNDNYNMEFIEGLNLREEVFESTDVSDYTSMEWWHTGIIDAQLIISDNFDRDGAKTKFDSLIIDIKTLLDGIDKAVSTSVVNSDISNFNNAEGGAKVEIGKTAFEILSLAKDAYTFTEGFYNPALYYNVLAYGFGTAFNYPKNSAGLPKDATIAKYTDLASHFDEIVLSESEDKYYVTKPEYTVEIEGETYSLKLDLGGISKGYAVDRIEELFDSYGYDYGMFNYGSSSMLVRGNVRSGNYRLGLLDPRSRRRETYIEIPARNKKLSTSGDNEQFYIIDGVRYCHILDPTTGKPVQKGIMSATVIGGSAAESDALTTAIMCMGKDKAIEFIKEKLTDRMVVFTYGA